VQADDPHRYDDGLAKAVKRFQGRHGLDDGGIAGTDTMGGLNVSVENRIRWTEIHLERWRWLPHQLKRRYIMIKTAAFTLNAVDVGQVVLNMRVVVGRPARRSLVFSSKIVYLVVNPYWTVPTTIDPFAISTHR
jgi:murein L,D-transpeptidase YcbB/YkuD